MRTLSLMEQGVTLAIEGELFSIERGGAVIQKVRMAEVDEVLVFGNVALTPAAVSTLLRRGIDTVFLSSRGRYRGRLAGRVSRNIELRVAQFAALRDHAVVLALARSIVAGKIANQRQILLRAQREQQREDLARPIAGLRLLARPLSEAIEIDTIRGLEGRAAAIYFGSFGRCVRNAEFVFGGRSRRPPRDPLNAMLSFGYAMLAGTVENAVLRAGFDPLLGAFHTPEYGRPSLVLDLMEEFRPIVIDSLVLRLVNRREVAIEDFERAPEDEPDGLDADDDVGRADEGDATAPRVHGVWLSDSGRRVFFRAWGRRIRDVLYYPPQQRRLSIEDIVAQQVYALARLVKNEASAYEPFVPR